MEFTAEQHLQMAKLLRRKAMALPVGEHSRAFKQSNVFLTLAAHASKDRGGLDLSTFDFDALPPDWSEIDRQVACLTPVRVDARKPQLLKQRAELWKRMRLGSRQTNTESSRLREWWSRFTRW